MIKVLFVISNTFPQGPINQLFYLCQYIDRELVEPYIVTTSQRKFEKTLHEKFHNIGVNIFDLRLMKVQSIICARRHIQELIDMHGINIIQSFGFRSDIIASNLKNVYRITTVRNTLLYNWKIIYGPIIGTILGRINLYYIKKFQSVLACSQSVHRYLQKLNLDSDVISNTIDPQKIQEGLDESEKEKIRDQLNLPKNSCIFLTVSSRLKGKNIGFLLNTFSDSCLKYSVLLVAGYLDHSIQEKFCGKTNIHFIGKVDNLFEYLKASNYFISASLHEGMPNAVLEAMSLGIPVILSDISPHQEIFHISKLNIGRIFQNNNSDDLRSKICEIFADNYSIMSKNCITTVFQSFNATHMAKQYCDFYVLKSEIQDKLIM